jgi:hypothetical protein
LFPVPPYGTETVDASHLPAEIFPTSVTCDWFEFTDITFPVNVRPVPAVIW